MNLGHCLMNSTRKIKQKMGFNKKKYTVNPRRNQALMESLVGGINQGPNAIVQQNPDNIEAEQLPEDAEALQKQRISSSGEDSEDSDKRLQNSDKRHQKNVVSTTKDSSASSNWSPRMALRHLSSFRRNSRDIKRKTSADARSYSFSSPARQSPSPSRNSLPRRFSRNPLEEKSSSTPTTSPGPPIRIATRSISPADIDEILSPQTEELVSVSPTNKPEFAICEKQEPTKIVNSDPTPSPPTTLLDKVKTKSRESLFKNNISSTTTIKNESLNTELLKQNIKLHINSKKLSENPRKSLSRSGLSPGTLKKAFQFTRSSSWTQKKLANASPPCIPKLKQEATPPKETNTPNGSPRRPSLNRASSFDTPNAGTPSPKSQPKNDILKELKRESLETPEEDENEDEDDSLPKSDDEDDDFCEKTWGLKKDRGSVQHERSQELDSPSNAALPILETPSVRGCEAAWVLRTLILIRASHLLQDRKSGNNEVPRCGIGSEMTEWLLSQSSSIHSRAQAAAMWQVLLEEGAIMHVTCEQPFRDKFLFYRFLEDNEAQLGEVLPSPPTQERRDAEERLPSIIAFLIQRAPDSTLRLVLRKPSHERSFEDQELIYEELLHLRALSHLSNSVKRELAAVIKFESHMREGAVLFDQGCEGKSWFIIVKGSVDVVIRGKGVVNTLQEGDDFGKLALVNDAPRAATIVLKEDNCQFLRVDKGDFNRILRDVEANTVRLKEHGKDVLVLEKVSSSHTHSQYKYTVMAGTPQKMLEHLLETRLDGRRICNSETLTMGVGVAVTMGVAMGATIGGGDSSDSHLTIRRCELSSSDFFLDDFLLTHIVFMPYSQLTSDLFKHYRVIGGSSNQDNAYVIACKRRVVHFTHRWAMTISDPVFANIDAANFIKDLKKEVEEDVVTFGAALRDESSLMLSVIESLERYEQDVSAAGVSKWKLPTSGKPISLFGASSIEDGDDFHRKIHSHDDIIFRVYCADHTYCTLRFPLSANGETIKRSAADKLGLNLDNMLLVELKSNGDVVAIQEKEVCIPTGITINGRLFVAHKDHLDALTTLPDQDGPPEGSYTQLEMFSTKELAFHITTYDWDLFTTIHEYEFLYQVFGRFYFGEVMCNLDVFRRRFNELQFWVATEMCLANTLSKRTQLLRKYIKLAAYCKEQQNLNAFFAIVIGLSNVAVSRLTQTWERLSSRFRKMYIEFEILIDPSRNHRAYRLYVAKLHPPIIPFTPLLMKDMTFTHEGNRTDVDGLVNFEKMHMLAQTLRTIRYCRSKSLTLDPPAVPKNETEIRLYVRNIHVIDNQRRLLTLSQRLEPKRP